MISFLRVKTGFVQVPEVLAMKCYFCNTAKWTDPLLGHVSFPYNIGVVALVRVGGPRVLHLKCLHKMDGLQDIIH